jgi:hypothetical protein
MKCALPFRNGLIFKLEGINLKSIVLENALNWNFPGIEPGWYFFVMKSKPMLDGSILMNMMNRKQPILHQ